MTDFDKWRQALSYLDEPPTDEEIQVLDENFFLASDDYGVAALLEMYRLGKAAR